MKKTVKRIMQWGMVYLLCLTLFTPPSASADGNIDTTHKYAWSETVGWIDFNVTDKNPDGVSTATDLLKFNGYAWAQNAGYIHFRNGSPEYFVMLENGAPTGLIGTIPSLFESSVKREHGGFYIL